MVACLWITEISSPFLHLRELLKELGYKATNLNLAVDVSLLSFNTMHYIIGNTLSYFKSFNYAQCIIYLLADSFRSDLLIC